MPPPSPAAGCRILVADDQREIIESVRMLLSGHGMTVIGALTPAEALSAAKAHSVDAALVDLNYEKGRTSGEQGLELVVALRRQSPTLPVIVMTAWSSIDLALEAMRRGARDFIEKPWEEPRLVGLLRSQAELGRALRRVSELENEVRDLAGRLDAGDRALRFDRGDAPARRRGAARPPRDGTPPGQRQPRGANARAQPVGAVSTTRQTQDLTDTKVTRNRPQTRGARRRTELTES